jgi:oligopeptide transport system substrate-binding protein
MPLGALATTASNDATVRTLARGNGPEPGSLDAHRAQDLAAHNILRDLYEGLVGEDARGNLVPACAESWSHRENARIWQFRLREDLRWNDGSALTASDFVWSFARALAPATASPMADLLGPIEGADAVRGGADPARLGVRALDARTLEIRLAHADPLLPRLCLPIAFPLHRASITEHGQRHTRPGSLVSNGRYRLSEWVPQAHCTLVADPHHRDFERLAIRRVRFHVTEDAGSELKRFLAGDLDLTETVPPARLTELRAQFGDALRVSPYLGTFWFGLNLSRKPFRDDPGLREALNLAIDRERLVARVTGFGESPAWGIVPPALRGNDSIQALWPPEAERLQRARDLYAASGYDEAHPLTIEIRYNTSQVHRRLALAVAAMWRESLGVRTQLRNEEWKSFVLTRRQKRVTEVFRGGWIADHADAMSFLEGFHSRSPLNACGFASAEYDDCLAQIRSTVGAQRAQLTAQAESMLIRAHVVIPLYHFTSKHLVSADVLGYEPNPLDRHPSAQLAWRA